MPWTENLLPALGSSWKVEGEGTVSFNNGIVSSDGNSTQIYCSPIPVNKELMHIRVIMRYRRTDNSLLAPHDNPCMPRIYTLVTLFNTKDPEDAEQQLYMQHISAYASQSYVSNKIYKKDSIPDNYCLAKIDIPVDSKLDGVSKLACNVFMNAPCKLYALSLQGKYAE